MNASDGEPDPMEDADADISAAALSNSLVEFSESTGNTIKLSDSASDDDQSFSSDEGNAGETALQHGSLVPRSSPKSR